MFKYLLVVWVFTGCAFTAMAQKTDSLATVKSKKKDTLTAIRHDTVAARPFVPKVKKVKTYNPDSTHSPQTAVIHSLIIPGWGQVYNHQVWKVPLIYAGLGAAGYLIVFNNNLYKEFLALAQYSEHGVVPGPKDPYYQQYQQFGGAGTQALTDQTDFYRRNRDLSIIGLFGGWGINIVDAYIAAKFIHSYTVDNNFSMKIAPGIITPPLYAVNQINSYIPAIKITFTLK